MRGDVCPSGEVEDESGRSVLNCLKLPRDMGGDSHVEGGAVVESGGDECMGNCLPGVGWEPFEDLREHSESEESGGGYGADLFLLG